MSETGAEACVATIASDDALLGGRITIRQPASGYRVAIDPVLLAAAAPVRPGERVLDLGAGVGAAALCLAARVPGCTVLGVELDPDLVALATHNAAANRLDARVAFTARDLRDLIAEPGESFDQVLANPPFLPGDRAQPDQRLSAATVEVAGGIESWIAAALHMLRHKGSLTLIHRADRLDQILALVHGHAGGIVVFPLWPHAGEDAKRVLVRARKGSAQPLRLAAGLVLHDRDGGFGADAEAVLRHAAAIEL